MPSLSYELEMSAGWKIQDTARRSAAQDAVQPHSLSDQLVTTVLSTTSLFFLHQNVPSFSTLFF